MKIKRTRVEVVETVDYISSCKKCGGELAECDCPDCKGDVASMVVSFENDNQIIYCLGNGEHYCQKCGEAHVRNLKKSSSSEE